MPALAEQLPSVPSPTQKLLGVRTKRWPPNTGKSSGQKLWQPRCHENGKDLFKLRAGGMVVSTPVRTGAGCR